ncbi:hypothetical protein Mapa_013324 [Marchantia paleacea]|nr:hypothetical protein Mapa_013324 [Marchantia paleacea]
MPNGIMRRAQEESTTIGSITTFFTYGTLVIDKKKFSSKNWMTFCGYLNHQNVDHLGHAAKRHGDRHATSVFSLRLNSTHQ